MRTQSTTTIEPRVTFVHVYSAGERRCHGCGSVIPAGQTHLASQPGYRVNLCESCSALYLQSCRECGGKLDRTDGRCYNVFCPAGLANVQAALGVADEADRTERVLAS